MRVGNNKQHTSGNLPNMAKPDLLDHEDTKGTISTTTKSDCYNRPPTAKKISFSIVVMSVPLLYVSLLHISPSSLFNDTRFWFLMSNAIILIVAADSGLFAAASDAEPADIYQEYLKYSRSRWRSSGLLLREPAPRIVWKEEEPSACLALVPSRGSGTPREEEQPKKDRCSRSSPQLAAPNAADAVEEGERTTFGRSESEKKVRPSQEEEEEQREYAAMSDEELNRRVEEFIRRFNREIRRQEVASEPQ